MRLRGLNKASILKRVQKKYYNDEPTVTSTTPEKSLSTNLKSNASEQARIISRTLGLSRITSKGSLFVIGGLLVLRLLFRHTKASTKQQEPDRCYSLRDSESASLNISEEISSEDHSRYRINSGASSWLNQKRISSEALLLVQSLS